MSPQSPTSEGQAYRRHLARTSRGRNFTQPRAQLDASRAAVETPVQQTARPSPTARHQQTLDEGDDEEEDDEDDLDDTQDAEDEEESAEVGDGTEDIEGAEGDGEGAIEEVPMEVDIPFDATGLKEIGNLASWTVSTCKPGCGVEALRSEDTNLFWQSDGPQPHHLNIHFSRLVSILAIRLFLDFEADESYTPTRITLLAGTGYHDLIPFSSLEFTQPKGWIDVPLEGVGGGPDGNTLRAFLVQVKVVENHQNGKDTHVRGLKIYARDEKAVGGLNGVEGLVEGGFAIQMNGRKEKRKTTIDRTGMLTEPDWMGEPELR